MLIFKICIWGILFSLLMVLWSIFGDFVAVWIGPIFFGSTSQDIWDLAISRMAPSYLMSRFIWSLPIGLIVALFLSRFKRDKIK